MNKFLTIAIPASLAITGLVAPAGAQEIVVTPPQSIEAMVEKVSKDLDHQLASAERRKRTIQGQGIAIVRFQAGEDGRPTNLSLYRRSGSRSVDDMARFAVRHLDSLHPLPAGVEDGQLFQANIIIADSRRSFRKFSETLASEEAARLASTDDEKKVLAFSVASAPAS